MTRQGKIKESQPHQCNERTQLLPIALERPYDGGLLVAGGRAHVHWQPNNIRLGWSGDLKREKLAHGGGGRLWGLGCATAKLKIESERIGGQRSNYDVK